MFLFKIFSKKNQNKNSPEPKYKMQQRAALEASQQFQQNKIVCEYQETSAQPISNPGQSRSTSCLNPRDQHNNLSFQNSPIKKSRYNEKRGDIRQYRTNFIPARQTPSFKLRDRGQESNQLSSALHISQSKQEYDDEYRYATPLGIVNQPNTEFESQLGEGLLSKRTKGNNNASKRSGSINKNTTQVKQKILLGSSGIIKASNIPGKVDRSMQIASSLELQRSINGEARQVNGNKLHQSEFLSYDKTRTTAGTKGVPRLKKTLTFNPESSKQEILSVSNNVQTQEKELLLHSEGSLKVSSDDSPFVLQKIEQKLPNPIKMKNNSSKLIKQILTDEQIRPLMASARSPKNGNTYKEYNSAASPRDRFLPFIKNKHINEKVLETTNAEESTTKNQSEMILDEDDELKEYKIKNQAKVGILGQQLLKPKSLLKNQNSQTSPRKSKMKFKKMSPSGTEYKQE